MLHMLLWVFLVFVLRCQVSGESHASTCYENGFEKLCFTYHSEPLTYWEANRKCQEVNSSLATIPNADAKEFAANYLKEVRLMMTFLKYIGYTAQYWHIKSPLFYKWNQSCFF